ncbi:MAG: spore maturation protein [Paludibacter sp.]|jgi:spore maturation protein SpmA|nr:spore maturation protein [Paludibacter sp.]MBP6355956.1 spore maturation protein [Paludibacter sp.]
MILNYIWIGFIFVAFIVACFQLIFNGNTQIFTDIIQGAFGSAKTGFEISLGLTGVLSLWLGIMKVGEKGGVIQIFARIVAPFFTKILPDIPKDHPALGSIFMNVSANMLGLDNAATPMGLKAMKELQEINPDKETASNPMIMFLVLNTAGLCLIPISIMVYRAQLGAANPADVFLPIMIATFIAALTGLISVAVYQKINLLDKTILGTITGLIIFIAAVIFLLSQLSKDQIAQYSSLTANFLLFGIIVGFIAMAVYKKVNVYESFIEGAKEGFHVAVGIIPYLIAILVAIGIFRASGAMTMLTDGITWLVGLTGMNTDFVGALPTALMKPLSGSGARGMMVDAMTLNGADSFVGRLSCIIQGSTDTTFYILAVYFGSVGIKNTRYALACGLFADFVGIVSAILLGYLFFH